MRISHVHAEPQNYECNIASSPVGTPEASAATQSTTNSCKLVIFPLSSSSSTNNHLRGPPASKGRLNTSSSPPRHNARMPFVHPALRRIRDSWCAAISLVRRFYYYLRAQNEGYKRSGVCTLTLRKYISYSVRVFSLASNLAKYFPINGISLQ